MNESGVVTKRDRGTGRIFRRKRSRFLWLQYYSRNGEQIRISSGTDNPKKAETILRQKIGEVEAGVHPDTRRLTYEDLREAFYNNYEIKRRKSLRHKEGKPHLDKIARLDRFFSGYSAADIDVDLIDKFIKEEQARGLADATINRSLSGLRRMFNLARKRGKLRQVPAFELLKESAPRQGFFEPPQYEALSRALPDYLRLPFALGYFTGMRLGEILGLKWEQVDFLAGSIGLRTGETKNNEARTIPIIPHLRALLLEKRAKRQPDCPYVCFRFDKKGNAGKIGSFRKVWQSRCLKLGLGKMESEVNPATGDAVYSKPRADRKSPKPKAKMVYRGMIFHDLRRTGVRNLVRAGVPERVARDISGHKTRAVFDRYDIVSKKDVAEAGRKLAIFHGDISGTLCTEMQPVDSPEN